jgi:dTDP-4-dehydrorhamnose 3,5-epimerase
MLLPDGVVVLDLAERGDARGSFTELFRQGWLPDGFEVAQANLSRSRAGVVRGMHYHRRQSDFWCFVRGRASVALADLRGAIPPEPVRTAMLEIDADERLRGILIPPGVAHGFAAVTDASLLYLVDRAFDGHDEFGFSWNDPSLGITWPVPHPVVSERDADAPPLARALAETPVG